ncbi:hypothetical protein [Candidatus Chlorohelix sp.]|uniref:hypothetical protein n=1 Tax=Candidatus Chlorohelix sp. TaxID=3139201 RepID=UPI0030506344
MGALPPLYAKWLKEIITDEIEGEKPTTCDNCAMCSGSSRAQAKETIGFYNPLTKCCTYLPELPNFLVGRILLDSAPPADFGKQGVEARIEAKEAITPFGVGKPDKYTKQYRDNPKDFGQNLEMRCPHYIVEGGLCGLWTNRNSVCTTWFCKHQRGQVAREFWKAMHEFLNVIETTVVHWCVLQLDPGIESLAYLFPLSYDSFLPPRNTIEPEVYQQAWGTWLGREKEFYIECARLVETLSWQQIAEAGGVKLEAYRRLLEAANLKRNTKTLPIALYKAKFKVIEQLEASIIVSGYSPLDPINMPVALYDTLDYFDGKPIEKTLEQIKHEKNLKLNEGLVQKLLDFGILTEKDPEKDTPYNSSFGEL